MAPQCGLAPGLIGIIGNNLASEFDKLRDIELRVGALPRYPNGQLAYSFTWSPEGVINEYINDAQVIQNGVKKLHEEIGIKEISICMMDWLCHFLKKKLDYFLNLSYIVLNV